MPNTMAVIGRVASPLSGATPATMIADVATITVLLPPASACATASTSALRRARRSSKTGSVVIGSAEANMKGILRRAGFYRATPRNATALNAELVGRDDYFLSNFHAPGWLMTALRASSIE